MNKQQLITQAKHVVDERRFVAEDKAQRNLEALRQINEYNLLERKLRQAQIDLAMGNGDSRTMKTQVNNLEKELKALIKKLGYEGALIPQYSCAKCNDTGYINGKICNCLQAEIRKLIVAESNVINSEFTFANSTEKNKHNLAVYKKARLICEEGKTNLLLTGNTGSGKTYLLTACVNKSIELDKSVLFVTAYSLNATFLNAHLEGFETRQAILDNLVDVDVLAIDDLGTENVYKNVTAEYFFSVLNERIARKKQTLISTNLTLNDIRERYDERIFSRLVDQNTTFVAQLIGIDKRIKRD